MKSNNVLPEEYFLVIACILLGATFFLADSLNVSKSLRNGVSYVVEPIVYEADKMGRGGREYLGTFSRLREFREEYNELSVEIYEKDVENAFYTVLREENESLKKQVSLGNPVQKYVLAKVLGMEDLGYVSISEGEASGIAVGDVVGLGNLFTGIVTKVDLNGSLVRLPTSRNNSFEVVVAKKGVEEGKVYGGVDFISRGVMKGSSEGLRIENVSMEADVQNGDVVLVSDSRVGEFMVVGYIVGLSENPAATYKSGFVSPVIDYGDLKTVFVRISS